MKQIVCISLGRKTDDYMLKEKFLGHHFHIRRFGTDGNLDKAEDLLLQWNKKADAVGLGHIQFLGAMGSGTSDGASEGNRLGTETGGAWCVGTIICVGISVSNS